MSLARALLAEPYVHFLALGLAAFLLHAALVPEVSDPRVIHVDAALQRQLSAQAERRLGRPPSPEEQARIVAEWVDDEILVRQAVALGLDRRDPVVRARVVENMRFVHRRGALVPEPTEDELAAYLGERTDLVEREPRFDLQQVFVAGRDAAAERRAQTLRAELAAGAQVTGDPFPAGDRFRRRSARNLRHLFGPDFVDALLAAPLGAWQIVPGSDGLHVVRVEAVHEREPPSVAELRPVLVRELVRERRERAARQTLEDLRSAYRIVVE
jgi:hypothetical protein